MKNIQIILAFSLLLPLMSLSFAEERPAWLSDVKSACPPHHLCAIGEGVSYNMAAADGRKALSLIFESKIKSTLTAQETAIASEVRINVTEEINQSTEGVLTGAIVIKSAEDKTGFYVLIGLDKMIAGNQLKEKIAEIDAEMKVLASEKTRTNGEKLLRLHLKRAPLYSNYQVLTEKRIASAITYPEIVAMKNLKSMGPAITILSLENAELRKVLEEKLISLGHSLAKEQQSDTITLDAHYLKKKDYINIDGFVRYTYTLELTSKKGEQKLGVSILRSRNTARTEEQTEKMALQEIEALLKEKLLELNLE